MLRKRGDGKKGEVLVFVRSGCWFALLWEERPWGCVGLSSLSSPRELQLSLKDIHEF